MTCTCCREWMAFATFAETSAGKCSWCQSDHDTRHPEGWRDAAAT